MTERAARVGGPLVLGQRAEHHVPHPRRISCSDWARLPTVMPLVRVDRPESRSMVPASAPSSVVLPVPLRPTTPIRSPAVTPSDTRSSSGRSP